MRPVKTTCAYCGVGCGIEVQPSKDSLAVTVTGDKSHPANHGTLCSKGSALGETLNLRDRQLFPEVKGERVSWDSALDTVASGFQDVIDKHGPEAVAFYVSGQLLTEDYYVANKFVKGWLGHANIDTNSRLCMSSAVVAHNRAFGEDVVPGNYEDIEQAELIVLVGSNAAWCHPILFKKVLADRGNKRIVVIDPRRTPTAEQADLHLPVKPGTDVALFNGLLAELQRRGVCDDDYIAAHTNGFDQALAAAQAEHQNLAKVAAHCGLALADLEAFVDAFASTEKTVSLFSMGVNQSSAGADKGSAIIHCHLATGRIGKAGMGPFSITGQPNAMGGREVGGMANMLAAHMSIEEPAHRELVQRFWGSPAIAEQPGLKAVDLFDAIDDGKIKAVWIMATNPAASMPNASKVQRALKNCEMVVVSDCYANTDTMEFADIRLPATGWGEKNGTVTNSERRISRQRPFATASGEAQADWWAICQVAKRMGFQGFDYQNAAAIFAEHAALSAFENTGERAFNLGALSKISTAEYDALEPFQWPLTKKPQISARLFGDGRFSTPDGRARFTAVRSRAPANATDQQYPLILNTGRVRDHWHTMTRTAQSAKLSEHRPEPILTLHPEDALKAGLSKNQLAVIESKWGKATLRIDTDSGQRRGECFAPMHWTRQFASAGAIDQLVNPAVDPDSGEPEFKHTPVSITAAKPRWYGFVLSADEKSTPNTDYWIKVPGQKYWRWELAGSESLADAEQSLSDWLTLPAGAELLEFRDPASKQIRLAWVLDGRLLACALLSSTPELPSRGWMGSLFGAELSALDRRSLLLGEPLDPASDPGPVVCSCFGVGRNTLVNAIAEQGLGSVAEIGACLKAGTNCGSCVSELGALIEGIGAVA